MPDPFDSSLVDDHDIQLLEVKMASQYISMLEFNIRQMMENCQFPLFSDAFYLKCLNTKNVIWELRSQYVNEIKFAK